MSPNDLYVSTAVAAELAGVSVRTVRRWAKAGHVPARLGSHRLLVDVGAVRRQAAIAGHGDTLSRPAEDAGPAMALDDPGDPVTAPDGPATVTGTDLALVALIERQQQTILELSGRLGFYQSEIQHLKVQLEGAQLQLQLAQARILELEAPKEAPAEMANHPSAEQNGQGVGAQTVSEMAEERPETGRRSEVSAPPATKDQEGSSSGALKRFWRWLTQPVQVV